MSAARPLTPADQFGTAREGGFEQDFTERGRMDRIDAERGRIAGPQAAAEAVALPAYHRGLNVTLAVDDVGQTTATLQRGIAAVAGDLVRVKEPVPLTESEATWMRPRVSTTTYYIYLGTDGTVYLDILEPQWVVDELTWAHPINTDRISVGHLYVGLNEEILYASPQRTASANILIAASDQPTAAHYYCTGADDQLILNIAAKYLIQRFTGGTINLTQGNFRPSAQVFLRGPFINLVGEGRATKIWADWATRDTGTTTNVAVNLQARAEETDDPDDAGNDGDAAEQVRELEIRFNDPVIVKYHTASESTITDTATGQSYWETDLPGRIPEITVGDLDASGTRAGDRRMFTDGEKLYMQRADGTQWRNVIQIAAAGDDGLTPTIHVLSFNEAPRFSIEAKPGGGELNIFDHNSGSQTQYRGDFLWSRNAQGGTDVFWDYSQDLSHNAGSVIAGGDVQARGNLRALTGGCTVRGDLIGSGNGDIGGDLDVGGKLEVGPNAHQIPDNRVRIDGNTRIHGRLFVQGSASLGDSPSTELTINAKMRMTGAGVNFVTSDPRTLYYRLREFMPVGSWTMLSGKYIDTNFERDYYGAVRISSSRIRLYYSYTEYWPVGGARKEFGMSSHEISASSRLARSAVMGVSFMRVYSE